MTLLFYVFNNANVLREIAVLGEIGQFSE